MPNTFVLLATTTVGSGGAATIDFTSIPATYKDLVVKLSGRQDTASGQCLITFNGSSSSLSSKRLYTSGIDSAGTVYSDSSSLINPSSINPSSYSASIFGNSEIYIVNYASSTNYKPVSIDGVTENSASEAYGGFLASLWSNVAAITRITLTPNGGNFVQYSSATLYGIKNS